MATARDANMIPVIRRLVTSEHGENYWFDAQARYVMESLGEYARGSDIMTDEIKSGKRKTADLGFWLFAAITGDCIVQHYKFGFMGDGVNAYRQAQADRGFFEGVFGKCGYRADYVFYAEMANNADEYIRKLKEYVDRGVPVISLGAGDAPQCMYVGYEDGGRTLVYITGDSAEPLRIACDTAVMGDKSDKGGWIFVSEKIENIPADRIYLSAVRDLEKLFREQTDDYAFGAEAFRRWADDVEGGVFDRISPEEFEAWGMYQNFVCVLATNGSCANNFLKRAMAHLPELTFLNELDSLYAKMGEMWGELETIGGGFNITLETLKNAEKRSKIAEKLREFALLEEQIYEVLNKNTIA